MGVTVLFVEMRTVHASTLGTQRLLQPQCQKIRRNPDASRKKSPIASGALISPEAMTLVFAQGLANLGCP
jgi:hypothetical protein